MKCQIGYVEAKNEVGVGGADSYVKCIGYYIASLKRRYINLWSGPCFIMASFYHLGRDKLYIDRLVPLLWFTQNKTAMEEVARTLKALKISLHSDYNVSLGSVNAVLKTFGYSTTVTSLVPRL